MAMFNQLALSALTRNEEDAGTSSTLNVTVNVDGEDVLDRDFDFDLDDGEAYIRITSTLPTPFDSSGLTNSSIRVGIRDDDAWAPQHILLFGPAQPDFQPGRTIALAMETDLSHWLSIDPSEGHLTMPLRLVGPGDSTTQIRRVLLLVDTAWSALGPSGTGGNTGTDSDIELEIIAGGNLVLKQQIHDTSQPDLERGTTNWYLLDPAAPFTRGEVLSNGGIRLSILGSDAWRPQELFVFGLDTATGRPNNVVSLVSLPIWSEGWMSTDLTEGKPAVDLPVVSV
jgi:hypothetical protein